MTIRRDMCILLLVAILFVSCKFFGNNSSSKEDASFLPDAANKGSNLGSKSQPLATSDKATAQRYKNTSSSEILVADDPVASGVSCNLDKQEATCKLTEDDKEVLRTFFSTTTTYQSILDSIYSKYTSSYNTIATYGSCDTYRIGCFSKRPSEARSQALVKLEENALEEEYAKLGNMLEKAVPSYNKRDLEDAIMQYKEAIKQANEAECKIETVIDYEAAQNATENKKKENVDRLKIVKSVLPIIKNNVETACLAYADTFVTVTANLSCSEFKKAIKEFNEAAKKYANGDKGDNAVSVIVGAISGMAYGDGFEDWWFNNAKMFSNNKTGEEVNNMTRAIDKLCAVYKRIIS
ncbi:hypothetical protein [Borreliella americana]|uniref:hypothetical protein n=1 Tax=Borreliella americana TaxID=478807 RepID=UPI001E580FF6|nr:hypothetical protein [Borreliella americana]MCD2332853.1 hypothetical protein [Borreliella americana]MCD2349882.1 hypothetical protein [Borreliella americana]MCD2382806.1 hypothetical protein [Borreliella americana]